MRKQIGIVTPDERDVIQRLFERKNGLKELAQIITVDNTGLYEKLVMDIGDTATKFQQWWDEMATKYSWESTNGGSWEIDFDTCEVFLVIDI